jgi:hypothetical protein
MMVLRSRDSKIKSPVIQVNLYVVLLLEYSTAVTKLSTITPFIIDIMKDVDGFLLKPIRYSPELDSFETLENTSDPELLELKQFIPAYGGLKYITSEAGNESESYLYYILL